MEPDKLKQTIEKFKDPKRARKNQIERALTRFAFEGSHEGAVLTLTGPAVERHVQIYNAFFQLIVVAEIDKKLANVLKKEINSFRKNYNANIILYAGDVFDYEHPAHLPSIRLLDLDFTKGWSKTIEDKIIEFSGVYPDALLRITYNARSDYSFDRISGIRELTHEIPYRAVDNGAGDPMVTAQFKPL